LTINRAKLEDRGEYIVRAKNQYGTKEEVVFLNVHSECESDLFRMHIFVYRSARSGAGATAGVAVETRFPRGRHGHANCESGTQLYVPPSTASYSTEPSLQAHLLRAGQSNAQGE
jgi:hypothetical protein